MWEMYHLICWSHHEAFIWLRRTVRDRNSHCLTELKATADSSHTHTHSFTFFPCTNTTSACADTHLQHLVPVHAQQHCRLSLSPWPRSRGSFGSADKSEEERMRRESELELHFVTVIVTQCPLSLSLLKERKVLNSYCQLRQCVDLSQCRCLIEKPFKKQLVKKHVTYNNLCWQLVGTAPQMFLLYKSMAQTPTIV